MKLYNAPSGNSKRVRIFIAEKNIQIPIVELELGKDTRTKNYKETVNSLGEVPALELEDGQIITESQAICRYLEALYPTSSLMGRTALEKAHIDMWSERIYVQLFLPYGLMVKHTMALFSDVVEQVPTFAQSQRRLIPRNWQWLDNEMAVHLSLEMSLGKSAYKQRSQLTNEGWDADTDSLTHKLFTGINNSQIYTRLQYM